MSDTEDDGVEQRVEVGDEVTFVYGDGRKSTGEVVEVRDWCVRIDAGGLVRYEDIKKINGTSVSEVEQ